MSDVGMVKENHDLREVLGDIWNYHKEGHWIVITTNGTIKKNGEAVMGRGVAKQASLRFPQMSKQLGSLLKKHGNKMMLFPKERVITFPVKHNWFDKKADLELIKENILKLKKINDMWATGNMITRLVGVILAHDYDGLTTGGNIYLVRPGCGAGGLDWYKDVKPICEKYLDNRFYVVERLETWKPESDIP